MTEILLHTDFHEPNLPPGLEWFNPPTVWHTGNGGLSVQTDAPTDFWQRTHYGFQHDSGHALMTPISGDFVMSTRLVFFPAHQYDQAGLMLRFSADCWIKTSIEFEAQGPARLGAVVTNLGYSDWSTQDVPNTIGQVALRILRTGSDCAVYASLDGEATWSQLRIAHLHEGDETGPILCGLYACSPIASGYRVVFRYLHIQRPVL